MKKQPSFVKFFPVAAMIGASAALIVYLSSVAAQTYPWASAVWLVFITWALYFMGGARVSRMHKYVLGTLGGVFAGWVTIAILGTVASFTGPELGLPATVFIVATAIVLLELTDWFELAPAYFFSFAGFFAFVFGGWGGSATMTEQAVYVSIMLMVGLAAGFITASLRKSIFNVERVPFQWRETIYDKERK